MATAILEDAPQRSSLDAARADDNRTARPRRLTQMRALIAIPISVLLASANPFAAPLEALGPGEFVWEPELSPSGPLVILVSLPDQTLSAYRNGIRIAYSSISSGRQGRSTPPGVFTILEKEVTHFSNKYHHAPMPYMQRLSWEGVAMHAGELPGYPASHGCIPLPREFAKKLYSITTRGTTVVVADEKKPELTFATHPGILLTAANDHAEEHDLSWEPEQSPDGANYHSSQWCRQGGLCLSQWHSHCARQA
jgi:L,D-transpeptidase catalytic domain